MKFPEIFSFLTILKETIQILPRNGTLTASNAILSLLLPSILILSFIHFYQYLTDTLFVNDSQEVGLAASIFLVQFAHLLVYFVFSHVSGLATILVSSASYTGNNSLSSKDVLTSIKITWRKPLFYFPGQSGTNQLSLILVQVPLFVGITYPNIFTISGAVIVWTVFIGFRLYSSVVWDLSVVVMVLEGSCCSREWAEERAGELVKGGHRLRGFMLNLFVNLVCLVVVVGPVWGFGWKGSLNVTVLGLLFINVVSVMKMVLLTAYTVLYFQCRKHGGEEIVGYGDANEYTKLLSSSMMLVVDRHEIP